MDTLTASVKIDESSPNRFEFITVHKSITFQADNANDANEWVKAIKNSIQLRIDKNCQVHYY